MTSRQLHFRAKWKPKHLRKRKQLMSLFGRVLCSIQDHSGYTRTLQEKRSVQRKGPSLSWGSSQLQNPLPVTVPPRSHIAPQTPTVGFSAPCLLRALCLHSAIPTYHSATQPLRVTPTSNSIPQCPPHITSSINLATLVQQYLLFLSAGTNLKRPDLQNTKHAKLWMSERVYSFFASKPLNLRQSLVGDPVVNYKSWCKLGISSNDNISTHGVEKKQQWLLSL